MKDIVVLGGPNGAGKTTAAEALLADKIDVIEFINADEIARALAPANTNGASVAAGRIMLDRMEEMRAGNQSFAFETTCSGRTHARFLERCKAEGWRVVLLFLWLPSPEAAIARVARRVAMGGHSIPAEVIIRRYRGGIVNMHELYLPLADVAAIYDNSDEGRKLIAEKVSNESLAIRDPVRWAKLEEITK